MKNHKTVLMWACGIVAMLLIIFAVGEWAMFGTFIQAANSIEKLEDELYAMEFDGDYGFDDFLAQGGAASDSELADYLVTFLSHGFYKIESDVQTGEFGCSTICTKDEHGSMIDRMQTLAAIYVPLDGMNEKGLVVADLMAGDKDETHQRTDKTDLTTTTAIRLLLDRAADVDEAIALLEQYDMNSSIGSAHHLSFADANRKSETIRKGEDNEKKEYKCSKEISFRSGSRW